MPGTSSRSELHQLTEDCSPAQARMLGLLLQASPASPVSTITVREEISVGNPSAAAIGLCRLLAPYGWHVRCEVRRHRNKFGQHGCLGYWHLEPIQQSRAPARRQPEGASA